MTEVNRQTYGTSNVRSLLFAMVATLANACAATPTHESTGGYIDNATSTAKIKTDLAQDNKVNPLKHSR